MADLDATLPRSDGRGGRARERVERVERLARELSKPGHERLVHTLFRDMKDRDLLAQVESLDAGGKRMLAERLERSRRDGAGAQTPADADRTLWMDAPSPAAVRASLSETVRFGEWLMAVYPTFRKLLPTCWIQHPELVLEVEAVRLYAQARWAKPSDKSNLQGFVTVVAYAAAHIRSWASDDTAMASSGHRHGLEEYDVEAARARVESYRRAGLDPDLTWTWPYDPLTGEASFPG